MPTDMGVLEELQDLLDDDGLPAKATNRLLLAGILSLKNQVTDIKQTQIDCAKTIKDALEPVKKNPAIVIGDFIRQHPKISTGMLLFFLVLSNIWFIDDFRIGVLTWLKIPPFLINLLH